MKIVEVGKKKAGQSGTELLEPLVDALAEIPKEQFAGAILLTDTIVYTVEF